MAVTISDILGIDSASAQARDLKRRAESWMRRTGSTFTTDAPADLAAEAARIESADQAGAGRHQARHLTTLADALRDVLDYLPDDIPADLADARHQVRTAGTGPALMPAGRRFLDLLHDRTVSRQAPDWMTPDYRQAGEVAARAWQRAAAQEYRR